MEFDTTKIDWTKFGAVTRQHRLDKQLSQSDVAKELGISQAAVSLIERGSPTGLTDDRLAILLSLLDIPGADLPTAEEGKAAPAGQKVFVSYSHKDKEYVSRLLIHLRPLEKKGLIDAWVDTRIAAGEKWKEEIQKALKDARAAVLLISADFLASDFIIEDELPPLLKNADEKGTIILPVVLKPCRFTREKSLAMFQSINSPEEPVSGMDEHGRELVYDTIAQRIEALFDNKP
jgi:transcriptional regulator with XRE-family HTH domain